MPGPARRLLSVLWHRLPTSMREWVLSERRRRRVGRNERPLWTRRVMDESIGRWMAAQPHSQLDLVEISGVAHRHHPWRSHFNRAYPEFDVCAPFDGPPIADVVTCEQVLEHVVDPLQALRSMAAMLRPGGHLVVSVPFLIRIHPHPEDYWRFSPSGLRRILEATGFEIVSLESWGNRRVVGANLRSWAPDRPWRSRSNDPLTPVVVWGVATRPIAVACASAGRPLAPGDDGRG